MADGTGRRIRLGFRTRVLGCFVGLVAAAVLVGLFVERTLLLRQLDRDVDAALDQEHDELEALAREIDPTTGLPRGSDARALLAAYLQRNLPGDGEVYLTIVDGRPVASTPAPARLDRDGAFMGRIATLTDGERGQLATSAGAVRYLAVPLRLEDRTTGALLLANFLQDERDEIADALRVKLGVGAGILGLATVAAWFVAGRLLRPVRNLTEAAEAISDTDLDRRIPVEGDDELARLARRFNEMLDRLAGAFGRQRAFVDDAGHELRTPITIVRGHLEVMGDDPDERRDTIALVTDELDRMARIVDDLLVLAKAEQPDFIRPAPVDVGELTADLATKAEAMGPRGWTVDAGAAGTIDVDRQRITQAVLNLARNALEHTAADVDVGLGSRWQADALHLWVRDAGPGIPVSQQTRVFDRFARGDGPRRSEGAGLGLAIARSIADAHGGRLELDSAEGSGARFTLVLPGGSPRPLADTEPTMQISTVGGDDPTVPIPIPQEPAP